MTHLSRVITVTLGREDFKVIWMLQVIEID